MSDPFKIRKSRKQPKINPSPVYELPKKKTIRKLVERARAINDQLSEVKPLYNELDQITLALSQVGEELPQYGVILVDNFSGTNTQFKKVTSFRRFELKWVYMPNISVQRTK